MNACSPSGPVPFSYLQLSRRPSDPRPELKTYVNGIGETAGDFASYSRLPYHASIPGGLFPSRVITVSGVVPPTAKRFEINLCTDSDIAFHLNPRFDENTVVRNTQIQGHWGSEERSLPFNITCRQGHSFMVEIICEAHCYRVAVDGQHLLEYAHRLKDLPAINHLEVSGDLELTAVKV